ncbi:MAG: DUF3223 domain-containing protein [Marinospirillum sp.]|uniref:DUF3223 domain-containing protein n=1 Tax=Marinospirillum sp. TaxID=2183934 RepID=UPI0019FC4350|nr:DUF3223 domain-containing protein [Marinospirillum sp.]MBE0505839.1 DUF3223 domain-containing protein [Marinospirillum sp.]
MSRFSITVGNKTFPSKKAALSFYKQIIDRYGFGENLSDEDAKSLIALGFKEEGTSEEVAEIAEEMVADFYKNGDEIPSRKLQGVMVDRHPDFRTTKCFYFFGDVDGKRIKDIFSYRMAINGLPTDIQTFSRACRFSVHDRVRKFKIDQFKNRPVQCALTGDVVEWEECQVDHKAPLTFSVIVKSFIVSNDIDISKIEYEHKNSRDYFSDSDLSEKFYDYHRKMAVLRIVSTKENLKLSGSARVKPTQKDGVLKD